MTFYTALALVLSTLIANSDAIESKPAKITDFPWMILVGILSDSGFRCTGVIIAPRYAITNPHCVLYANDLVWKIRSGSSSPEVDGTKHDLQYIFSYFDPNDIDVGTLVSMVILRVRQPFVYDETRQPIPIIEQGLQINGSETAYLISFGSMTSQDEPTSKLHVLPVTTHEVFEECGKNSTLVICISVENVQTDFKKIEYDGVLVIDGKLAGVGTVSKIQKQEQTFIAYQRSDLYWDWILQNIDDSTVPADERLDDYLLPMALRMFACYAAGRAWLRDAGGPGQLLRMAMEIF